MKESESRRNPKAKAIRILRTVSRRTRNRVKTSHDFLEGVGFNAIADEKDAKKRMSYIERFTRGVSEFSIPGAGVAVCHVYAWDPGN